MSTITMIDLKIHHIRTMAYLLSKGARHNYVKVTTTMLGHNINRSQQASSRHLLELEEGGFIDRAIIGRSTRVRITPKGFSEIVQLTSILQNSIKVSESSQADALQINIEGTVVSGMGEGAYYMSLEGYTKQFKSTIGYIPFPGTFNVRLDSKIYRESAKSLASYNGIKINSFSDGKRTYGWAKCFPAKLNETEECEIIILERTHHDDSIIEIISKKCLRDATGLKDGSKVYVTIMPNSC